MCIGREKTYEEFVKEAAAEVRELIATRGVDATDVVNEPAEAVIVEKE